MRNFSLPKWWNIKFTSKPFPADTFLLDYITNPLHHYIDLKYLQSTIAAIALRGNVRDSPVTDDGLVVKHIQGDFFNWPSPENVSRLAPPKFAWTGPPPLISLSVGITFTSPDT